MLLINQRLDKLAAMRSDFTSRITISGGCLPGGNITHLCNVQTSVSNGDNNEDDDDGGPVDEDSNVLGHVILARSRGTFTISLHLMRLHSDSKKRASILGILRDFPSTSVNLPWPT